MEDFDLEEARRGLAKRYREFRKIHCEIARKSRRLTHIGSTVKTALVVLGAISASQAVFTDMLGPRGAQRLLSVVGIITSGLAGLSAAFKWERRGGELFTLATVCATSIYQMHDEWQKVVSEYPGHGDAAWLHRMRAVANRDLDQMGLKLGDMYNHAGQLGAVDVALSELTSLDPDDMFELPRGHASEQGHNTARPRKRSMRNALNRR